jgi:HEAT repeat protein
LKTAKDDNEAFKAARALAQFGPKAKEAIPALAAVIKKDQKLSSEAAADSLSRIGPDATPALKELVKGKVAGARVKAIRALASDGSKKPDAEELVALFTDLLKNDPDGKVRTAAAYGLPDFKLEAKKVVPILAAGLKDKDGEVVMACAFYLGALGKDAKSVVPDLVAVVKDQKRIEDVREQCLMALSNLGPDAKEAVNDLIAIAQKDTSKNIRIQALRALSDIDPDAAKKLQSKKKKE